MAMPSVTKQPFAKEMGKDLDLAKNLAPRGLMESNAFFGGVENRIASICDRTSPVERSEPSKYKTADEPEDLIPIVSKKVEPVQRTFDNSSTNIFHQWQLRQDQSWEGISVAKKPETVTSKPAESSPKERVKENFEKDMDTILTAAKKAEAAESAAQQKVKDAEEVAQKKAKRAETLNKIPNNTSNSTPPVAPTGSSAEIDQLKSEVADLLRGVDKTAPQKTQSVKPAAPKSLWARFWAWLFGRK